MLTVCPYEPEVHPLTSASLERFIPHTVYRRVGPGDFDYWNLLCELWARQESLIIVEHDMELHSKVYPSFLRCPQPWCAYPYPCIHPETAMEPKDERLTYTALGCTRFRSSIMRDHPDLLASLDIPPDAPQHLRDMARRWRGLDAHVVSALTRRGYEVHTHWPQVIHHHDYPRGCACGVIEHESLSA